VLTFIPWLGSLFRGGVESPRDSVELNQFVVFLCRTYVVLMSYYSGVYLVDESVKRAIFHVSLCNANGLNTIKAGCSNGLNYFFGGQRHFMSGGVTESARSST
jgi:hypothetical protein